MNISKYLFQGVSRLVNPGVTPLGPLLFSKGQKSCRVAKGSDIYLCCPQGLITGHAALPCPVVSGMVLAPFLTHLETHT